jgi:ApeA N-terminal domain 1
LPVTDQDSYPISVVGTWWLRSLPELTLPGRLTIGNCEPQLEVYGNFEGLERPTNHIAGEFDILGVAEGREYTLFDPRLTYQTGGILEVYRQEVRPNLVAQGRHFPTPSEVTVASARLRFTYLEDWLAQRPFSILSRGTAPFTLEYTIPEVKGAELYSDQGSLEAIFSPGWSTRGMTRRGTIRQTTYLQFDFSNNCDLSSLINNYILRVGLFLTIATNERNHSSWVEISAPGEDSAARGRSWIRLFAGWIQDGQDKEEIPPFYVPFPEPCLGLGAASKWLQTSESMFDPLALSVGALHGDGYLQTRVLEAVTSLEGVHRRCFSSKRLMTKVRARRLRADYKAITPKEEWQHVSTKLSSLGEPTFRTRLSELYESVDGALAPLVTSGRVWAAALVQVRNGFAHQLETREETDTEGDTVRLWILLHTAVFCAIAISLRQVGISGSDIAAGFGRLQIYQSLLDQRDRVLPGL